MREVGEGREVRAIFFQKNRVRCSTNALSLFARERIPPWSDSPWDFSDNRSTG